MRIRFNTLAVLFWLQVFRVQRWKEDVRFVYYDRAPLWLLKTHLKLRKYMYDR